MVPLLCIAVNEGFSDTSKPGFVPVLVNGHPVKSVNQFYKKRKARLQQKLGKTGTTKRMERLTNKRTRRINYYLHTASKQIIDLLESVWLIAEMISCDRLEDEHELSQ